MRKGKHLRGPTECRMLTVVQIEQFIETIFPSQPKPADKQISPEEAARLKAEAYEAKWDNIYLISAVLLTLTIITGSMVRPHLQTKTELLLTACRYLWPGAWVPGSISLGHRPSSRSEDFSVPLQATLPVPRVRAQAHPSAIASCSCPNGGFCSCYVSSCLYVF
jgi:hypothetical protein